MAVFSMGDEDTVQACSGFHMKLFRTLFSPVSTHKAEGHGGWAGTQSSQAGWRMSMGRRTTGGGVDAGSSLCWFLSGWLDEATSALTEEVEKRAVPHRPAAGHDVHQRGPPTQPRGYPCPQDGLRTRKNPRRLGLTGPVEWEWGWQSGQGVDHS